MNKTNIISKGIYYVEQSLELVTVHQFTIYSAVPL